MTWNNRWSGMTLIIITTMLLGSSIVFSAPNFGEAYSYQEMELSGRLTQSWYTQENVVSEVPVSGKYIALTFDDGPDELTEAILDVLDTNSVKATFFVVGENCVLRASSLKRMYSEGHEIGNHTYSHMTFRGKSESEITKEILHTNQVIQEITGETPYLFRPPGGTMNQKILNVAQSLNLRIILWSPDEDSKDWSSPGVGRIIQNVVPHAKEGKIVLLHDGGGKRQQTLQALPRIISDLHKSGYTFVTVTQLLKARTSVPTHK